MTGRAFDIRDEAAGDRAGVRRLLVAAFAGEAEAELVDRLRDDGDVLISLVAAAADMIVGNILFSRLPIDMPGGPVSAAALAPLAVLPECQGQGIGTALVRDGLGRCRHLGALAVVVLGDPSYYVRFGFTAAAAANMRAPWSGPHLMAIELVPGGLRDGAGIARYARAFAALPP